MNHYGRNIYNYIKHCLNVSNTLHQCPHNYNYKQLKNKKADMPSGRKNELFVAGLHPAEMHRSTTSV